MDDGFVEREDVSCIKFSKNAKLFLIRLPKEIDYKSLDGMSVKTSDLLNKDVITKFAGSGGLQCELRKDIVPNTIRPIIKNSITGGYSVGDEFSAGFFVRKDFSILKKEQTIEEKVNSLPVTFAYDELLQIPDLSIRCLPKGSLSTIEELNERLEQNKIVSISKKRSASIALAESPIPQNRQSIELAMSTKKAHDLESESKRSKKEKKEKKEKREKKDKESSQ